MDDTRTETAFVDMGLPDTVMVALTELGWEIPTPIQSATIPTLMAGNDVVGQAQTGTGKTAAFVLPALARVDISSRATQVLILTPTRELCIQVAEVLNELAVGMKGLRVLAVYGGQGFTDQLTALKRGVQVVVGTPGRVMDHMRRETLKLGSLSFLVLDEADEMLHMGFIEDVEWILEQTPAERQTALFSATMPPEIRRIARKYLKEPEEIMISNATTTAENITHKYWITQNQNKFEVLARILETEEHDGVLIFSRTKSGTLDIAEKLCAAGIQAAPLNGDMKQVERERTVNRFKDGKMDVLVATDVAARGLDVDRISHVINYDPPHDTEGYVHRVGRTGRAGRSGTAIIIATPRERRFLGDIERATRQRLEAYEMPTLEGINRKRIEKFKAGIARALEDDGCGVFAKIVEEFQEETGVPAINIAAALAKTIQGNVPLTLDRMPGTWSPARPDRGEKFFRADRGDRPERTERTDRGDRTDRTESAPRTARIGGYGSREAPRTDGRAPATAPVIRQRVSRKPDEGMDRYRVECGHCHGVMPGNIVGAIANEAGLRGADIGHIEIFDDYSTVDLPTGMPEHVFTILKRAKILNRALALSLQHQAHQERYDKPERHDRYEPSRGADRASTGGDTRSRHADRAPTGGDTRLRKPRAAARPAEHTEHHGSERGRSAPRQTDSRKPARARRRDS